MVEFLFEHKAYLQLLKDTAMFWVSNYA